jgi:hypothetical protein
MRHKFQQPVVQGDFTLKTPAELRGKRIATPQLGNTQDVATRSWLVMAATRKLCRPQTLISCYCSSRSN